MIQIEILDKEYDLPEGWHEVSVEKFEKIIKHSTFLSEYKSQMLFALEMIAIILDAPLEDIKRLNKESFEILADKCAWAKNEIMATPKDEIHIGDEVFIPIKDFNKLTMGDTVSIELMIAESKPEEVLGNILPVLVRKGVSKVKEGKTILVPGEFDADEYSELKDLFKKNIMVTDVMNIKTAF